MADHGMLRPITGSDLERVLAWRNHPNVRRYMLTRHEISMEEHQRWFERASSDEQRCLLLFEDEGIPLGFVHFTGVVAGGISDWGFYTAPEAPRGTGRKLGRAALRFGFEEVRLHKVCGQVLGFNEGSLRFHTSLGFQKEGVLRQHHYDGAAYHDMICFGLLFEEWMGTPLR